MSQRQDMYKPLASFVNVMQRKLRKNEHKGGWKDVPRKELMTMLIKELHELLDAVNAEEPTPELIINECADVANFAMMIADNSGGLK